MLLMFFEIFYYAAEFFFVRYLTMQVIRTLFFDCTTLTVMTLRFTPPTKAVYRQLLVAL
jgi:hypothetical protein